MAGVTLDGGSGGGRRSLDSELNMVPMIDLLMVTIAFLLVTAVWSHMSRIDGSTQVPGHRDDCADCNTPVASTLHVDMRPEDRFVLSWRAGHTVVRSVDVPRRASVGEDAFGRRDVRFPELAAAVASEWRAHGSHAAPGDSQRDEAVLHTADDTPFSEMIGAMDAVYATKRDLVRGQAPAFAVTLATQ